MSLKLAENVLQGVATLSEGETQPIWCKSPQGYFYVEENNEYALKDICDGVVICRLDKKSLKQYLDAGLRILNRYKPLFRAEHYERFLKNIKYFEKGKDLSFYIANQTGGGNAQNQLKIVNHNDKQNFSFDWNDEFIAIGEKFRQSILAAISRIRFEKNDSGMVVFVDIVNNWGDIIMKKSSKVDFEKLIIIFEEEMRIQIEAGNQERTAAQIFGIKYEPLIKNNRIDIEKVVEASRYNKRDICDAVKNGMELSPSVLFSEGGIEEASNKEEEHAIFLNDYKRPKTVSVNSIKYRTQCQDEITGANGKVIRLARNRIFFGAPGTGKSYELNEQTKKFVGGDNAYYERVTFHPEYTHFGFFGTYKPVPNPKAADKITYAFIPGPFLRVFSKALINANSEGEKKPYVLLIEEINRANVASVFGEVFQLLDREDDVANAEFLNASKYSISPSEDVKKYLVDEFEKAGLETTVEVFSEIRIPDNMFVWASMNSADQGVFPMDTAFKRRWEFAYFGINNGEEKIKDYFFKVHDEAINWNALRKAVNYRLTSLKINEDKLMGPFFLGKKVLNACTFDHSIVIKAIQNKVIMYLFEDAGKQKRKDIFVNGYEKTYSEICTDFEEKGLKIFAKEIVEKYNEIK